MCRKADSQIFTCFPSGMKIKLQPSTGPRLSLSSPPLMSGVCIPEQFVADRLTKPANQVKPRSPNLSLLKVTPPLGPSSIPEGRPRGGLGVRSPTRAFPDSGRPLVPRKRASGRSPGFCFCVLVLEVRHCSCGP